MSQENIAQVEQTAQPVIETTNDAAANDTVENKQVEQEDANKVEDTPFPKKAVNAISRRDKQIGKLRAQEQQYRTQLETLQKELEGYRSKSNQPKTLDDFKTLEEFMDYAVEQKVQGKLAEKQTPSNAVDEKDDRQAWLEERSNELIEAHQNASENVPDYAQVMTENADIINSIPPQIEELFLEADRPEMALYALAKEGKLERIAKLSTARAAMEIAKAEERGIAMTQKKQITKAPTPIASTKGTSATGGKSLDNMNSKELLELLRS